jgi:aryl-alcohol dehydrogenase-like predicted oxidoreductase
MGLRGTRTWGVRVVSDEDADRFLNAVLDAGINFVDTAPDYGISEERIGRYLSSRRAERSSDRRSMTSGRERDSTRSFLTA